MSLTNTTPQPDVSAVLARQGWTIGLPATVTPDVAQIDANAAAAMKCPNCRRRGLAFTPLHRYAGYRALARCPRCGFTEEV